MIRASDSPRRGIAYVGGKVRIAMGTPRVVALRSEYGVLAARDPVVVMDHLLNAVAGESLVRASQSLGGSLQNRPMRITSKAGEREQELFSPERDVVQELLNTLILGGLLRRMLPGLWR
jgi:hypothetical protein